MFNAGYMDELRANREDREICKKYLEAEEDMEVTALVRYVWRNGTKSGPHIEYTRISWLEESIRRELNFGHHKIVIGIEKGMQVSKGLCESLFDAYAGIGKYRK